MTKHPDSYTRLHSLYKQKGGVQAIFSKKTADYTASRPDYPAALFTTLYSTCKLSTDSVIADIGAGTGLLTQGLLHMNQHVIAIEPNTAMREACDHFLAEFSSYCSMHGSAESIPLAASSVDLITAAQAFHWFEIEKARAECMRVLKPHGQVALIWNDRVQDDPLHIELDAIFAEFGGAKRAALSSQEERAQVPRFFGSATAQEFSWPHEHVLDQDGIMSLVFSRSYMPERTSSTGKEVKSRVEKLFKRIATAKTVTVRYTTIAIIGRPA